MFRTSYATETVGKYPTKRRNCIGRIFQVTRLRSSYRLTYLTDTHPSLKDRLCVLAEEPLSKLDAEGEGAVGLFRDLMTIENHPPNQSNGWLASTTDFSC